MTVREHGNVILVHRNCGRRELSEAEFAGITAGTFVKVLDNDERFWAEVVERRGNSVMARVDNDLVNLHDFAFGDIIEVTREQVIGTYPEDIIGPMCIEGSVDGK